MIKAQYLFLKNLYSKLKKTKINLISNLPTNCDVIIYDEIREKIIRDYFPSSKKIFVMKNREICLYTKPILLLNTFRNLLKKELIFLILINVTKKDIFKSFT